MFFLDFVLMTMLIVKYVSGSDLEKINYGQARTSSSSKKVNGICHPKSCITATLSFYTCSFAIPSCSPHTFFTSL